MYEMDGWHESCREKERKIKVHRNNSRDRQLCNKDNTEKEKGEGRRDDNNNPSFLPTCEPKGGQMDRRKEDGNV